MIKFVLNLFKSFFGLKHSIEHLENIKYDIAFYSVGKQSEYADTVCIEHSKDIEFLKEQFKDIALNDPFTFQNMNSTSVGNMAYLSLHAPLEDVRDKASLILKNYRQYVFDKLVASGYKTSLQWLSFYQGINLKIIDADGWGQTNFDFSFNKELISKQEFFKRLSFSTVSCSDMDKLNKLYSQSNY